MTVLETRDVFETKDCFRLFDLTVFNEMLNLSLAQGLAELAMRSDMGIG